MVSHLVWLDLANNMVIMKDNHVYYRLVVATFCFTKDSYMMLLWESPKIAQMDYKEWLKNSRNEKRALRLIAFLKMINLHYQEVKSKIL
jgi:hypothetical protein